MDFTGKTAISTGAASGMGLLFAQNFAALGGNVLMCDVNEPVLLEKAAEINAKGQGRAVACLCDVRDYTQVCAARDKAVEEFGRIDVLINNAQASASGIPLARQSRDHFDLGIYSGLYATFYYMRECYPYLKETQGSVINFASGAGLFGNAGQCSYAAAKEGIRGLSRVAATEWGKDNINVNIVCPLAMTSQLENFRESYPEAYEKNLRSIPMGRFGDPEADIGRVCVHLGSPDFKYMSGETITLEGGMGLRP